MDNDRQAEAEVQQEREREREWLRMQVRSDRDATLHTSRAGGAAEQPADRSNDRHRCGETAEDGADGRRSHREHCR